VIQLVADGNSWLFRLVVLTNAHVVGTLHSVSVWAMAPLISLQLQLSAAQFGLFVSAYYGAQTCCAFPAGALVDRIGVGRSLIAAMLILSCGALGLSQVSGLPQALACMAVMGVGYSIVNPATARGVINWFAVDNRATAMGVKQTGVPLGGVLAAVCGILASQLGWRMVLGLVAAITLANVLLILPLLGIRANRPRHSALLPWQLILGLLRDRNLRVFGVSNTLLQIGQGNFFAYLTLFLRDVGNTSQGFASACLGLAQVASAAGRVGWGVICDRYFAGRRVLLVLLITGVAAIGLLSMALITADNVRLLAILLSSLLGVTIAAYAGLTLTVASESVPADQAGTAVGFNLMMVGLGGVLGPPLFGLAMDYASATGFAGASQWTAGWLVTALAVVIAVALLRYRFKERVPERSVTS